MEILFDPEEKIMCPYNPAHYIMRYRMNTHLIKCKKSYPESKLVECDFNVNHRIPEPELQYHHENCPDRRKVEITVYQEEGSVINKFPVHNIEVPTEETWDDLDVPSYDPQQYCESSNIVRHLDVESAAIRKNFRVTERQRISQLKDTPSVQREVNNRPLVNVNSASSRRNLPDRATVSVQEETPESVSELMERLKVGKNKAYLGK